MDMLSECLKTFIFIFKFYCVIILSIFFFQNKLLSEYIFNLTIFFLGSKGLKINLTMLNPPPPNFIL